MSFRMTWDCSKCTTDVKFWEVMEALKNTGGDDYRPLRGFLYRDETEARKAAELIEKSFPGARCTICDLTDSVQHQP